MKSRSNYTCYGTIQHQNRFLQETKWFGSNVYRIAGAVVLTSGRNLPPSNEPLQRGEGVALVLCGDAISSWEAARKQWRSWSSRMVSACFKIGEKQHYDFLHVVSCYAPTWGSSRIVKDEFWDGLDSFLCSVPSGEEWILLGDFNARVGSRVHLDDQWTGVRGPYGVGELRKCW